MFGGSGPGDQPGWGTRGAWEGHCRKLIKAALPQGNNSIIFKAPKVIGARSRSAQIQKVAFVQLPAKHEMGRKLICTQVETRDLISTWLNTSERDKGNKVIQWRPATAQWTISRGKVGMPPRIFQKVDLELDQGAGSVSSGKPNSRGRNPTTTSSDRHPWVRRAAVPQVTALCSPLTVHVAR